MKRKNKLTLGIVGLAAVALFASGCTANFATNLEKSRIAYALDSGVSEFIFNGEETVEGAIYNQKIDGTKIRQVIKGQEADGNVSYSKEGVLNDIISSAKSSAILTPTKEYFAELDLKVFKAAEAKYNASHPEGIINQETLDDCLTNYGYVKFYADDKAYDNYKKINKEIRNEKGYTFSASLDFENYYLSSINTTVDKYRSTITVFDDTDIKYGNYYGKGVTLGQTTWKDAWGKGGHLIEGLIVYPVAALTDSFARMFAGGKNATPAAIQAKYETGGPQILSILLVTVIVRLFIFLVTFRSVIAQKKMAELQPELAKIQQKYPNSNTNQAQKQRLAEEQMRLYKKHKVNPLSQLLVLIVQFPIFIGVWGAMTGSAVLSTGAFLKLNLSESIWEALKLGPKNHAGWWTALVLILLMSLAQFFAMKVPQWIQKAKTKKVSRLGTNPAQKQQNRTANMISYVMLIMIIVMGFTLPAAMGVYWFVGAIVSLIQTVFTNVIFAGDKKKK